MRSRAAVSPILRPAWSTKLSTRASAPVIAGGKVFVADVDAHAVCALDGTDGDERWRFIAGARVDAPPTYHRGLVLFGSRDGWVYALRAEDGALIWRFKALPERMICAYGQIESTWPVHGSILIKEGVAYFTAGRNSFLDGGIFLFGLDPMTGRLIHQQRLAGPYSKFGFPMIPIAGDTGGMGPEGSKEDSMLSDDRLLYLHHQKPIKWSTGVMGLEGHKADIMLADDRFLYLRHQAFELDLNPVDAEKLKAPHLITSSGFIDAIPHHRSFWTLDTTIRSGLAVGPSPVHGDILVKDGNRFYEVRGYQPGRADYFDPRVAGYKLFAGEISPITASAQDAKAEKTGQNKEPVKKSRLPKVHRVFTSKERWSVQIPLTGKAMMLAGDVLFVAGTPVAFPKDDLAKAYEGRMGGVLWAVSAEDGRKLAEYKLDTPPVWDSLAAAHGRLILCTEDGRVRCFTR